MSTEQDIEIIRAGLNLFIDLAVNVPKVPDGNVGHKTFEAHRAAVTAHSRKQDELLNKEGPKMANAFMRILGSAFLNLEKIANCQGALVDVANARLQR